MKKDLEKNCQYKPSTQISVVFKKQIYKFQLRVRRGYELKKLVTAVSK